MLRRAAIFHSRRGTTLAGSAIVLAPVAGDDGARGIIRAAAIGGLAGVPVAWRGGFTTRPDRSWRPARR